MSEFKYPNNKKETPQKMVRKLGARNKQSKDGQVDEKWDVV